jgi:hypothetical protein
MFFETKFRMNRELCGISVLQCAAATEIYRVLHLHADVISCLCLVRHNSKVKNLKAFLMY